MPIRYAIRQAERFFVHRVLHVDDTPHRIALGMAIGMFVAWTPTIGLQMMLTVVLATLLRANKVVGVPFAWISNPLTLVPVYYPSYLLGKWLLGSHSPPPDFAKMFTVGGSWWGEVWFNRVQAWWQATMHAFWPLWVGSVITGLILAAIVYFSMYHLIVFYREHRRHHHRALRMDEPAKAAAPADTPPQP